MKIKAIQLVVTAREGMPEDIRVLADDGTVWRFFHTDNAWFQMPELPEADEPKEEAVER